MLEPLIEAIETVKERIEQHRQTLSENETRTRGALINPILKALGWDPGDPALVTLEYNVGNLRADYALLDGDDKPAAVFEAKKLGEALDNHRMQMLNYANTEGIEYAGLTNGDKWELYSVFERGHLNDRRMINVSISKDEAHECALELLTLWRLNLASGKVKKVNPPIIEIHVPEDEEPDSLPDTESTQKSESDPSEKSTPISEYKAVGYSSPLWKAIPKALRFPDGSEIAPTDEDHKWAGLMVATAEWLFQNQKLTDENIPIRMFASTGRYIIHTSEVHRNGKPMVSPESIQNGRYFVEKHDIWPKIARNNINVLLKHGGVDPSEVYLITANVAEGDDG
ncbi:MAG: hypothetical protein OXT69_12350 [Candidatus Poribacteria bacterium]|nr:hypothetical protein [Candidatus Poribacteria bacterium]